MRALVLLIVSAAAFPLLVPSVAVADTASDVKAAYVACEMLAVKRDFDAYRASLLGKRVVIEYQASMREESALTGDVYDALSARFPDQKIEVGAKRNPPAFYEEALQREASTWQITIDGDLASIRQPNQKTNYTQHMRRVNGVWRYVAEDDIYTEKELRKETARYEARVTAYKELLAGLKANKYKSAEEARSAFENRSYKLSSEAAEAIDKKTPSTPPTKKMPSKKAGT